MSWGPFDAFKPVIKPVIWPVVGPVIEPLLPRDDLQKPSNDVTGRHSPQAGEHPDYPDQAER